MANEELTRSQYLRALYNQRKLLNGNGSVYVNPSITNTVDIQQDNPAITTDFSFANDISLAEKEKEIAEIEKTEEKRKSNVWTDIASFTGDFIGGFFSGIEGILDLGLTAGSGIADLFGADTDEIDKFIKTQGGKTIGDIISKNMLGYGFSDWTKDINEVEPFQSTYETKPGQFIGSVGESIGAMLPGIALAAVTGGGSLVSLGTMFLSAGGRGAEEAMNEGADKGKALLYGTVKGGIEVATEKFVGKGLEKIPGIGKIFEGIGRANVNGVQFAKNMLTHGLSTRIVSTMLEEGAEEVASELLAPLASAIYKGDSALLDYGQSDYWSGVFESFLAGAVAGGVMDVSQKSLYAAKYSTDGLKMLELQGEYTELIEKANQARLANNTELFEQYSNQLANVYGQMIDTFKTFQENHPKQFEKFWQKAEFTSAEQFKRTVSKPVLEALDTALSTKVSNATGIRDFSIKVVDASSLTKVRNANGTYSTPKAFYNPKTHTVVINSAYQSEFGRLFNHEVISHVLLDSNKTATKALIKYIESKPKLSKLFHQYDSLFKDIENKSSIYYRERLARFIENQLNDPKAFAKIFSSNPIARTRIARTLRSIINKFTTFKGSKRLNNVIIKNAQKALAELSKTNKAEAKGKVVKTSTTKDEDKETVYSKDVSKEVEGKKVKKSAINRVGNKYDDAEKVMPKIWNKEHVKRFVDVFGGSGTVAMNSGIANTTINDNNSELVGIYKAFKTKTSTEIYNYIYKTIEEFKLRTKEGFEKFRDKYNATTKAKRNPLDLFLLEKFGRYSALYLDDKGNYKGLFGNGRALANKASTRSLISQTAKSFANMTIQNQDFETVINNAKKGDLLYLDPPYSGTKTLYNDNWTENDDKRLMKAVDKAVDRGVQFVMSNVFSHNGKVNSALQKWAEQYDVEHVKKSYHGSVTDEVIISTGSNTQLAYSKDTIEGNYSLVTENNRELIKVHHDEKTGNYKVERLVSETVTDPDTHEEKEVKKLKILDKDFTTEEIRKYINDNGLERTIPSKAAVEEETKEVERYKGDSEDPMDRINSAATHLFEGTTRTSIYTKIEDYLGEGYFVQDDAIYHKEKGKNVKVGEFELEKIVEKGNVYSKLTDYETIGNIKGLKIGKFLSKVLNKTYSSKQGLYNTIKEYLGGKYDVKDDYLYNNGRKVAKLTIENLKQQGEAHYEVKTRSMQFVETQEQHEARQKKFKTRDTNKIKLGVEFNNIFENAQQQPFESRAKAMDYIVAKMKLNEDLKDFYISYSDQTIRLDGQDFVRVKIAKGKILSYQTLNEFNKSSVTAVKKAKFELNQKQEELNKTETTRIIEEEEQVTEHAEYSKVKREEILWREVIKDFSTVKQAAIDNVVTLKQAGDVVDHIRKMVKAIAPQIKFNESRSLQTLKTAALYNLNPSQITDYIDDITGNIMSSKISYKTGKTTTTETITDFLTNTGGDPTVFEDSLKANMKAWLDSKSKPSKRAEAAANFATRIAKLNTQVREVKQIKKMFHRAYTAVNRLQTEIGYNSKKTVGDIRYTDADFLGALVSKGWFTPTGNVSGSIRQRANALASNRWFENFEESNIASLLPDTGIVDFFRELANSYDSSRKVQKVLDIDELRKYTSVVLQVKKIYENIKADFYKKVEAEAKNTFDTTKFIAGTVPKTYGLKTQFYGFVQKTMNPISVMNVAAANLGNVNKYIVDDVIDAYSNKRLAQAKLTNKFNEIIEKTEVQKRAFEKVTIRGMKVPRWNLYSLYMNLMCEYEAQSISQKGFSIDTDAKTTKQFKGNDNLLENVKKQLTEKEIDTLEDISDFLNGELKDYAQKAGEKVSPFFQTLEERYYPTVISATAKNVYALEGVRGDFTVDASNSSYLKSRTGARNAVQLVNPLTLVSAYIDSLTNVAEVSLTMKKAEHILNKRIYIDETHTTSVMNYISEYTPEFRRHWSSFMAKLMGRKLDNVNTNNSMWDRLAGKYSTAVLGLNIGSQLTQAASLPTGMNLTGIRSALKALTKKTTYNFLSNHRWLMENNGVYAWRVMDHGLVKGLTTSSQFNQFNQRILNKATDLALLPMEKLDQLWALMEFGFAQQHVADVQGFAIGTEENLAEANKLFTRVILETMSNSDPIAKSMLRSGEMNKFMQYTFGMFGSDAQQKLSLFTETLVNYTRNARIAKETGKMISTGSYGDYSEEFIQKLHNEAQANVKFYGKGFGRYLATLIASGVIAFLAKAVRDWLYGRKDFNTYFNNKQNTSDTIWNLTAETFVEWVPFIGQIKSWITYDSINAMPVQTLFEIVKSCKTMVETIQNGGDINASITNLMIHLTQLLGLPANNIKNIVLGILRLSDPKSAYKFENLLYARSSSYLMTMYNEQLENKNQKKAVAILYTNLNANKVTTSYEVASELSDLYANGYEEVIPKNYMTEYEDADGNTTKLSSEQVTAFRQIYDRADEKVLAQIGTDAYRDSLPSDKAKTIKKLYNTYYEYAKYVVTGVVPSTRLGKLLALTNGNIDLANYVLYLVKLGQIEATKKKTKKELSIKYINSIKGMKKSEKLLLMVLNGYAIADDQKKLVIRQLVKLGMDKKLAKEFIG